MYRNDSVCDLTVLPASQIVRQPEQQWATDIPMPARDEMRRLCGTESKAFLTSMKIAPT